VQLLQLTHGHEIEGLRLPSTLGGLAAAQDAGLIGDEEGRRLRETYDFLMRTRNRLFWQFGRPIDVLPTKPEDLEAIGKAMGFRDQPRQEFEESYLRLTRRARRISEPLIYG
jgi:glutamate-ammonia-ligase adenylyltransferase